MFFRLGGAGRGNAMTDQNTPTMMKRFECADFQAVLSGFLDGVIDGATAHEAEVHLNECADCRSVVERAEAIDGDVRRSMDGLDDWPAALEDRIMTAALGRAPMFGVSGRRRLLLVAWTGWAAAAVAIVAFGVVWNQFNTQGGQSSEPVATATNGEDAESAVEPDNALATNDTSNQPAATDVKVESVIAESSPPVGSEWTTAALALDNTADKDAIDAALFAGGGTDSLLAATMPDHSDLWSAVALLVNNSKTIEPDALPDEPTIADRDGEMTVAVAGSADSDRARLTTDGRLSLLPDVARSNEMPAVDDGEPQPSVVDNGEAGDVLHQASILLAALGQAEDQSFSDVRLVQQALAGDDVLDRLADTRRQLHSAESVELVDMAWSVLEWTNGQLDQQELGRVRDSIARNDLPRKMERLSDQYWN